MDGRLGLSTSQRVSFCEFDCPRYDRSVIVTMLADAH
jgi:thiamine phosphate synthase YjbQ (UPF0047 family)